jgi:hypothetical protein
MDVIRDKAVNSRPECRPPKGLLMLPVIAPRAGPMRRLQLEGSRIDGAVSLEVTRLDQPCDEARAKLAG